MQEMKKRTGFVSNSSSSSFAVGNWTEQDVTLREFMQVHEQIVRNEIERMYGWMKKRAKYANEYKGKWQQILEDTDALDVVFVKGKQTDVSFTNESANEADGFFRYFFDMATSPDCKKFSWNLNWNSQAEDYSGDYYYEKDEDEDA